MTEQPKTVPREKASYEIISQKTQALTAAAAKLRPDALVALSEIRKNGIPIYLSGSLDMTGSMLNDIIHVNTGVAQFIQGYVSGLPPDLTSALGGDFLKVRGAVIKHRDIEEDGDASFKMTLFPNARPATFVQYATNINRQDVSGGGDPPESQLISLMLSLGIPRSNRVIGGLFEQIHRYLSAFNQEHKIQTGLPNFQTFIERYDEYSLFKVKPDMVYLVTDAPPKVQLGVDSRLIASLAEQTKLPKMAFFIRDHKRDWERTAKDLGAEIFDLERAGDAKVASDKVEDFMSRTVGPTLLASVNKYLPQLPGPRT